MATLRVEIVTAERSLYSDDVDIVIAPGIEGQLGILPHHDALMTMLEPGELCLRKGGEEIFISMSGGFLEVLHNKVTILADAAERVEEIDMARAEEAKRRAEAQLSLHPTGEDYIAAEAALHRSLTRLKVAGRRRRKEKPLPK